MYDISLVVQHDKDEIVDEIRIVSLPNKVFEYIMSDLPIKGARYVKAT